jgi:hypothetical protein
LLSPSDVFVRPHRSLVADAIDRGSLQLVQRAYAGAQVVDPLKRLFDPAFTETLWEYEFSRVSPEIPGSCTRSSSRRSSTARATGGSSGATRSARRPSARSTS